MIMVLSGTQDGRELTELLLGRGYSLTTSTATEYGASLMVEHENLRVISGRMNEEEIIQALFKNKIKILIDATHPYALEITNNALKACHKTGVKYYRYERRNSELAPFKENIIFCKDYEEAAKKLKDEKENILLTTGSKTLDIFTAFVEPSRLYPRILPDSNIIRKCEELGIPSSNIIAMQGPFSMDLNEALIRKYCISILVTKNSGDAGGTMEKLMAAKKMGIPVIMVERPAINCDNMFDNTEKLIEEVGKVYDQLLSNNA